MEYMLVTLEVSKEERSREERLEQLLNMQLAFLAETRPSNLTDAMDSRSPYQGGVSDHAPSTPSSNPGRGLTVRQPEASTHHAHVPEPTHSPPPSLCGVYLAATLERISPAG